MLKLGREIGLFIPLHLFAHGRDPSGKHRANCCLEYLTPFLNCFGIFNAILGIINN